ncbi:hypothetical protein [Escherichia coli]|nr:hypothetical protein [Escherichia coli]MCQ6912151.1 hypothetical protein [Escherichia coli]
MVLKIDPQLKQHRPSSDDVNLEELWVQPLIAAVFAVVPLIRYAL